MAVRRLALVSEVKQLSATQLERTAAALQIQLDRDFAPIWKIQAKIEPVSRPERIPKGRWPITIQKDIGEGAFSYHSVENGIPYARIRFGDQWQLGASHDMLEMLVDPMCNRTMAGRSIKPGERGRVFYMVQVCDPCSSPEYGYKIGSIMVSDFCTPEFFSGKSASRYSFTGAVRKSLEILKGGYISWRDPRSDHWWQKRWWDERPEYYDLGLVEGSSETVPSKEKGEPKRPLRFQMLLRRDILVVQQSEISKARQADIVIDDLIRRYNVN